MTRWLSKSIFNCNLIYYFGILFNTFMRINLSKFWGKKIKILFEKLLFTLLIKGNLSLYYHMLFLSPKELLFT